MVLTGRFFGVIEIADLDNTFFERYQSVATIIAWWNALKWWISYPVPIWMSRLHILTNSVGDAFPTRKPQKNITGYARFTQDSERFCKTNYVCIHYLNAGIGQINQSFGQNH